MERSPIEYEATKKRTHDYVRHGTTNLFAALNIATGEVVGESAARPATARSSWPF